MYSFFYWCSLTTGHALNSTHYHKSYSNTACLVRDAILNVSFKANWQYIKDRKQKLILQNNARKNATRIEHTYSIRDKVMVHRNPNRKHGSDKKRGPYSTR